MYRLFLALLALILCSACVVEETTANDDDDGGKTTSGGGGNQGGGGVAGGNAGGSGAIEESCDPYQARVVLPDLLIGPTGLQATLVGEINSAQTSIELMMYQLTVDGIINALAAAPARGVKVRALLDKDEWGYWDAKKVLEAGGVEVKEAPSEFDHNHAKVLIVDGDHAVVMSGNMNDYSMYSERNYGVIDRSADDIADLLAIFERDWSGADLDLSCTRLVVGPDNSRKRIIDHIDGAKETLDIAIMYISDDAALARIKAQHQNGVKVRVLLASPGWIDSNVETAGELKAVGIEVKYLTALELHAKLIVADGVAYVGSNNLSWTSLEKNREIGVFVTEDVLAQQIVAQVDADWAQGVSP